MVNNKAWFVVQLSTANSELMSFDIDLDEPSLCEIKSRLSKGYISAGVAFLLAANQK
jgi:hypothetical protein